MRVPFLYFGTTDRSAQASFGQAIGVERLLALIQDECQRRIWRCRGARQDMAGENIKPAYAARAIAGTTGGTAGTIATARALL
jgi:hypothetical protein